MKLKSKVVAGLAASCASAALFAAPASAESGPSLTVQTDAGTSCTIVSSYEVGSGLIGVAPIDFNGDTTCSLADPANPPTSSSGLFLSSNLLGLGDVLPLGIGGLGGTGGQPNSPPNTEQPPPNPEAGAPFVCRLDPGYDCGFSGRGNGLPSTPYQVTYYATLSAPEGETWTAAPEGCELVAENSVGCASITEPFTTN